MGDLCYTKLLNFMLMRYWLGICFVLFIVSCKHHQQLKKDDKTETVSHALKKKYAEKLAVSEASITNQKLYQFIDEWYAVPYKYAGKTKAGIDCSGLVSTLYLAVYQKTISPSTKVLIDEVKKIDESKLKEGDLVFFKIESKTVSHVGMYLQNNKFLHASSKKGVMISDLSEPYFKKYFLSAGRVQ